MAKKETFLLVSLEEDKAKKLAQVISNDTSRKILDYLANKKATETELSKELKIPISTVHYNIKALLESRLVEAGEFHYSGKGREVLHYSLANRYVIIAPKASAESIKDKLKSILPAIASIGVIAIVLQYWHRIFGTAEYLSKDAAARTMIIAENEAAEAMPMLASVQDIAVEEAAAFAPQAVSSQPIGIWFAIGASACMLIYLIIDYIIKRKK